MNHPRKFLGALLASGALIATAASPASAIVGGHDSAAGAYPSVARITFGGAFLCTGTLIAPNYVLTAGHCGSATGEVASPAAWPAALINVRIGGDTSSTGEAATVSTVTVHPNHLANSGYDITLLKLSKNSTKTPTKVAGSAETASWAAGTLETIAGWGTTTEGGSTPTHLQEAQVPITTDAYCAGAYSDFSAVTMICAGYPQGGTDTCQGDSGGPMFGTVAGVRRVVGATSYGNGCAQPGYPGVYARVGDTTLREWIRSIAPAGVA